MKLKMYRRTISHKLRIGEYWMINPSVSAEIEFEEGENRKAAIAQLDVVLQQEWLKAAIAELKIHVRLGKADDAQELLNFYKEEFRKIRIPTIEPIPTQGGDRRFCSVCGEAQFSTPSGWTCENGHGGADSVDENGNAIFEGLMDDLRPMSSMPGCAEREGEGEG